MSVYEVHGIVSVLSASKRSQQHSSLDPQAQHKVGWRCYYEVNRRNTTCVQFFDGVVCAPTLPKQSCRVRRDRATASRSCSGQAPDERSRQLACTRRLRNSNNEKSEILPASRKALLLSAPKTAFAKRFAQNFVLCFSRFYCRRALTFVQTVFGETRAK